MDKDQVFTMDLHEAMDIESGWHITRVPGGWIYEKEVIRHHGDEEVLLVTSEYVPDDRPRLGSYI